MESMQVEMERRRAAKIAALDKRRRLRQQEREASGKSRGSNELTQRELEQALDRDWAAQLAQFRQAKERSDTRSAQTAIDELTRLETEAAPFLPGHARRSLAEQLATCRSQLRQLQPRSSFAFRRRERRKKASPRNSAASNETRSTTAKTVSVGSNVSDKSAGASVKSAQEVELAHRENETLVAGEHFELHPEQDLFVHNCHNCLIFVPFSVGSARVDDVSSSVLCFGAVASSLHAQRLSDTRVQVATRQLRLHESRRVTLGVASASGPVIEHCDDLCFMPFAFFYPSAKSCLQKHSLWQYCSKNYTQQVVRHDTKHIVEAHEAKLENEASEAKEAKESSAEAKRFHWRDVKDFLWLRSEPSPHFRILPAEEYVRDTLPSHVTLQSDREY
ncbi:MAG: hypothetical protein MHM6MM_003756 [Cercozoa sp. M6MM]